MSSESKRDNARALSPRLDGKRGALGSLAENTLESNRRKRRKLPKRGCVSKKSSSHVATKRKPTDLQPARETQPSERKTRSASSLNNTVRVPLKASRRRPPNPIPAQACYKLSCSSFDENLFTRGISSIDMSNKGDILEAPEYVADLYQRLYHNETTNRIYPYIDQQEDLNESMRMIIVDWLVQVHRKLRLTAPSLHLCVNLMDRYLVLRNSIQRAELQLVAITSLMIASKYEEIFSPPVRDFVYVTDSSFSLDDILEKENDILDTLDYRLSVPTCHHFLLRFLFLSSASVMVQLASRFYIDRVLQEHEHLAFRPSLLSLAAVCLAINNPEVAYSVGDSIDGNPGIPEQLLDYSGFSRAEVMGAANFIAQKVQNGNVTVSNRLLRAVSSKYTHDKYNCVAVLGAPEVGDIKRRPKRKAR